MKQDSVVFYMHAGSGNHGCEAIVHTTCKMLPVPVTLMSARAKEDERYLLHPLCTIMQERSITQHFWIHIYYFLKKLLLKDTDCYIRYRYRDILHENARCVYISVGGDNYCYDSMREDLLSANGIFHKQGSKTVLWGCSIEPKLLSERRIVEDMRRYDLIVARESITYEALLHAGVCAHTLLFPDPAFCLEAVFKPLPAFFLEGNTVGVNISPLLMESEEREGITFANYRSLMKDIVDHTDMNIALIPHVIWENNDDRRPLQKLYDEFGESKRVVIIEDCNCRELKGYIARCRFFVGARTHATIAAYSSCVPTLVIGYSVKSKGIAKDLFGTDTHYVLPVGDLRQNEDLTKEFRWLSEQEGAIRRHLASVMPAYAAKAASAGEALRRVIGVDYGKN